MQRRARAREWALRPGVGHGRSAKKLSVILHHGPARTKPAVERADSSARMAAPFNQLARGLLRLFERADAAVELHLVDGARDFADQRRRLEAHLQEVAAHEQRRGRFAFD